MHWQDRVVPVSGWATRFMASVALFVLGSTLLMPSEASHAAVNLTVYNRVKQLEGTFPFPAPSAQIDAGYLDGATGNFVWSSGVRSETASLRDRQLLRKASWAGSGIGLGGYRASGPFEERLALMQDPVTGSTLPAGTTSQPATIVHFAEINAVNAGVRFGLRNAGTAGTVVVNGRTYTIPANSYVMVPVGTSSLVAFKITFGYRTFSSTLLLRRPAVIGAGAFTIPALPITIVYDPPQDSQKRNYARYSETAIVGMTMSTISATTQGSSSPTTTEYQPLMGLKSEMTQVSTALSKVQNPYAQAAGAALGLIAGGLGSADATQVDQVSEAREGTLVFTNKDISAIQTIEHLGPGLGDSITVLRNARMVWLGTPGKVKLALLGWDTKVFFKAQTLKEDLQLISSGAATVGPKSGLDGETIRQILALDPFAFGGQSPRMPAPRFQYVESFGFPESGICYTKSYVEETSSSDLNARVTTSTRVANYSAGYLSFAGLGVTQTGAVSQSQVYGTSKLVTQGVSLVSDINLCAVSGDTYNITLYRDTLYNVLAAALTPTTTTPALSGFARNSAGIALVRMPVTLTVAGQKFTTFTDAQGQYAFKSSLIPSGAGTVAYGTVVAPVTVVRQLSVQQPQLPQLQPSGGFTLTPAR